MQLNYLSESLYEKAEASYDHQDYNETIFSLERSLENLEDCRPPLKGKIYLLMIKTYYNMVQYRDVRRVCQESLEYFLTYNKLYEAAVTYQFMGNVSSQIAQYKEAIKHFKKALAVLPATSIDSCIQSLKAQLHISLGLIAQYIQEIELQNKHFCKSLFISKKIQNECQSAQALLGLGICFFQKHKFLKARKILLNALRLFHKQNNFQEVGLTLLTLGQTYYKTGENFRAMSTLEIAYRLFEEQADTVHQASSLTHLARIYLDIDLEKCQGLCLEATDLLSSQITAQQIRESEIILGQIYIVMGRYYLKLNQLDEARDSLQEGIEILKTFYCQNECKEAEKILQNVQVHDTQKKPKKNNILAFKLGLPT